MSWSPDIETSFSDTVECLYKKTEFEVVTRYGDHFSENVESLYKNTEYEVVTRYRDQFQLQRGVSIQKY